MYQYFEYVYGALSSLQLMTHLPLTLILDQPIAELTEPKAPLLDENTATYKITSVTGY